VGGREQPGFQAVDRAVVRVVGGQRGELAEFAGREQAGGHERREVDQVGIAGEGGEALVG
jgi:hypothetical protein